MARTNAAGQKAKLQRRRHEVQHACSTDWNNNLREIASLLPISDTMHGRGLSKKETLVHMLWYFEFLKTHIENLQARLPTSCLPANETESETETEDSLVSEPETPPAAQQAKRTRTSASWCHSPPLPAGPLTSLKHECVSPPVWHSVRSWTEPLSESDSLSSTSSDSLCSLRLLQAGAPPKGEHCSACDGRTSSEDRSPEQFQLVRVLLKEDGDSERERVCSSHCTPLMTPKTPLLMATGYTLDLSPSLLTSPTHGVAHGQEDLQTLFEDVWVNSEANVSRTASLQSSQSDDSVPDWSAQGRKRGMAQMSSQSEEEVGGHEDGPWTPRLMKGRRRGRPRAKVPARAPFHGKKKCVNGFIMFCRINRKLYLQWRPGTPSTVVTKALANIWHQLPKQERRIYWLVIKKPISQARRYSCQENRNVRVQEEEEGEGEGEEGRPSPLHLLLADRHLGAATQDQPGA